MLQKFLDKVVDSVMSYLQRHNSISMWVDTLFGWLVPHTYKFWAVVGSATVVVMVVAGGVFENLVGFIYVTLLVGNGLARIAQGIHDYDQKS